MQFTTLNSYKPIPNSQGKGYENDSFGFRRSRLNNPRTNSKTILLSGGSTAWGAGTKTEDTYAFIINDKVSKHGYTIDNVSVGGYTISQEINRIVNDTSHLDPSHIIMLSGWNDVYSGYRGHEYYSSPDMFNLLNFFAKHSPKGFATTNPQKQILGSLPPDYSNLFIISRIQRLLYSQKQNTKPKMMDYQDIVDSIVSRVEAASSIAKSKNAIYVFALQPTIYHTNKNLTNYEAYIVERNRNKYPDLEGYFSKVYPLLKSKLIESSKSNGYIFLDTDESIASANLSVFTDHVHFGDRGNSLIADFLLSKILKVTSNHTF